MFLSIVIPAHNEEERISKTLDDYLHFYNEKDVEFIVVLNACQDNTIGVVKEYVEKNPKQIRYTDIKEAIGKGGAVREGFRMAKGELIGFLDADASTSPEEFEKVVQVAKKNDGAIASRWKKGSKIVGGSFFREIFSVGFITLVRMLYWMPFIDTQCGAKVFKKKVIDEILPMMKINNMAFDVELLYNIQKKNFNVIEVPSVWIDNSSSSPTLGSPLRLIGTSINIFFTLIKIRFKK